MERSVTKRLLDILLGMERMIGIEASVLASRSGLVIMHDLGTAYNARKVAALATLVASFSERAAKELDKGAMSRVIVECERGHIICMATKKLILSVLARKDANLGMVLMEMEEAMQKIQEVLG